MKYIKTYEGVMWNDSDAEYHMKKNEFKFKFGDYVRTIFNNKENNDRTMIFYITAIKDTFEKKPINSYYLKYDDGKIFGWIKEDDLELVPDYEIDAKKYNL
jgi:hypothetical protein